MRPDVIQSLELSFNNLWVDVVQFIPEIVIALVVVIIGWIVGAALQHVVIRIFKALKVGSALDAAGVDALAQRAGYPFKPGEFVGALVKWFVIIVFFVAALDILQLDQVTVFFRDVVLGYLPKVIVAVLILLGATVVANVASASVVAGARATGFNASELLGSVTRYAILLFAVLAAMSQLEIAPELVQTLFMGIVFATSLAFGLAFGLGGKEAASRYISDMTRGRGM
ncbi:MAG: hypothetical protein WDZ93_01980 [Candidatus Paceibacterota bacterium]